MHVMNKHGKSFIQLINKKSISYRKKDANILIISFFNERFNYKQTLRNMLVAKVSNLKTKHTRMQNSYTYVLLY